MRRITAVGLSALALCGVIGTTAETANADTTIGQKYADTSRQAGEPQPIGKKHFYHYSIPGSDVSGVWYRAMHNGKKDIWLKGTVRHTADGQQAAACFKVSGVKGRTCYVTTTPNGANLTFPIGFVGAKAHWSVKAAVGYYLLQPDSTVTFQIDKSSRWHKLF